MKVGFIGLGTMGAAAAANIKKNGHALHVYDLDRSKASDLIDAGAVWSDSPAAVSAAAEVVITMVPGPHESEAVMRGPLGVLAALRPGSYWIDLTTNRPSLVLELAEGVRLRQGRAIDAPVTGAVDGAIRGALTLFAGGDDSDIAHCLPVLSSMGRVLHMGKLGAGCVTKLLTNQLWFIHAAAIGEALVLGRRNEIDMRSLWEALKGSVADSFVCRHDVPSIFAGHYDPSFSLDLCCKDLGLIIDLAESSGTQFDLTRLTHEKFESARRVYGGRAGELHVCKLIEDAANVSLRVEGDWVAPWNVATP